MTTPKIELTFLGGASNIGASCVLLQVANTRILVDCGIRLSGDPLPDLSRLGTKHMDAIFLTHAHLDHSGALPVVCEAYPNVPVYASPPTISIVEILLRDTVKVAAREGELSLYTERQVENALQTMRPVQHGSWVSVGDVTASFLPASHILGASMVYLSTPAGSALFTGDYSISAQRTVPALTRPELMVDMVVSEATYGTQLHENRKSAEERLISRIAETINGGGRVLIPAFAVGRAQEVLLILKSAQRQGKLPKIPVFVDGMVRTVCSVYESHPYYLTRGLAKEIQKARHIFYTGEIQPVSPQEREGVLKVAPCVIISSSGMLSGGPSVYYAGSIASNTQDAILLTGYQDEESPGRTLLALTEAEQGQRVLNLAGKSMSVSCRVEKFGLSAHADRMQVLSLLEALRPRTVVLTHGEEEARKSLGEAVSCRDVVVAEDGLQLERGYPLRRAREAQEGRTLDLETARRFLGPPTGELLSGEAVARAWYGRTVSASERERFLSQLEGLGVVRRDDRRRSQIWVLTPQESGLFPDEVALEERLKQENPKGKLLEFCQATRLEPPVQEDLGTEGAHFLARWSLVYGETTLISEVQRASSKKVVEQLAAADLLEKVKKMEAGLQVGQVVEETPDRIAELKQSNPKGRLMERHAQQGLPQPNFESLRVVDGFLVRVGCPQGDGGISWGPYVQASQVKIAEQAAAEMALRELKEPEGRSQECVPPPTQDARDARVVLNEGKQKGWIVDFGYEQLPAQGPAHQPLFSVFAWAKRPDGSQVKGGIAQASTKKDAQQEAARLLLGALMASEGQE